jgi:hypothetical protein
LYSSHNTARNVDGIALCGVAWCDYVIFNAVVSCCWLHVVVVGTRRGDVVDVVVVVIVVVRVCVVVVCVVENFQYVFIDLPLLAL